MYKECVLSRLHSLFFFSFFFFFFFNLVAHAYKAAFFFPSKFILLYRHWCVSCLYSFDDDPSVSRIVYFMLMFQGSVLDINIIDIVETIYCFIFSSVIINNINAK